MLIAPVIQEISINYAVWENCQKNMNNIMDYYIKRV